MRRSRPASSSLSPSHVRGNPNPTSLMYTIHDGTNSIMSSYEAAESVAESVVTEVMDADMEPTESETRDVA